MSLTQTDLQEIRDIVHSTVQAIVDPLIEPLVNEIHALRIDVKEIYAMSSNPRQ